MAKPPGLLGDLRESLVLHDRTIGELRGRDIEMALGTLEPRVGEAPPNRGSVEQMLISGAKNQPTLPVFPKAALGSLKSLQQLMRDRVGYAAAPELDPLKTMLKGLDQVMPREGGAEPVASGEAGGDAEPAAAARRGGGAGLTGAIDTRNDALRAIDMVCDYLERTERTYPAQLLLRRARRLVNKNFVELVASSRPRRLARF